ncbi:MAG: MBL fold metallo-hydrolase [Nannocystaceae bacterium]
MADLVITAVPCLRDYAYLVRGATATQAWVVDPSEPEPVIAALAAAGLGLAGVLATHHHPDHVGGVPGLLAHFGARPVAAHASDRDRIEGQSVFVDAPTTGFVDSGVIIDGRRPSRRTSPATPAARSRGTCQPRPATTATCSPATRSSPAAAVVCSRARPRRCTRA